jgi:hypothetical protein
VTIIHLGYESAAQTTERSLADRRDLSQGLDLEKQRPEMSTLVATPALLTPIVAIRPERPLVK